MKAKELISSGRKMGKKKRTETPELFSDDGLEFDGSTDLFKESIRNMDRSCDSYKLLKEIPGKTPMKAYMPPHPLPKQPKSSGK